MAFSRSRMADTWLSSRTRSVWLARSASRRYSTSVLSMTLLRRIHRFLNSCSAWGLAGAALGTPLANTRANSLVGSSSVSAA
jgi:hypothetical protein